MQLLNNSVLVIITMHHVLSPAVSHPHLQLCSPQRQQRFVAHLQPQDFRGLNGACQSPQVGRLCPPSSETEISTRDLTDEKPYTVRC